MKTPEIPANEAQRLAALHHSGLLVAGDARRFDRLTRLARRLFDVPVAVISLVDDTTLVQKSGDGVDWNGLARQLSFCGHVVFNAQPLIVTDTLQDPRFSDNPLVVGPPQLRFYAGVPLRLPDGTIAGSFCVASDQPRTFNEEETAALEDLSAIAGDELASVSVSTSDPLTGLLNRRGFENLANYAILSSHRRAEPLTLAWLDCNTFNLIASQYGNAEGDAARCAMATLLRSTLRDTDLLVRYDANQFAVLLPDTDETGAWIAIQHLVEVVEEQNLLSGKPWQLGFTWGVKEFDHAVFPDLRTWIRAAATHMALMIPPSGTQTQSSP
ncbi:sensor domain-containing diguanylate cyclase [Yokenella regensburgei]|jgi:diguanylate cyclase (GGDEF)-like protein|uniref:Probable diguanylate cyclase YeaP n=1 Tax=Yokenella regensburgei TaxID=158877 RepID=A0AB38FTW1_9ENTR|nr:sensor domain-containing diguanylate cyclase [Yokenella regensburgei]EHM46276.1 diguanylate cyclase domain protein [Yokenella regensburgei ATCC 43003]KAF1369013.1 diguanylate cyclase (GGDEF)-like protein [Yokenella regensburgei]KFD20794.1 diguanylate cyclase [Yokenella regensburgei ATCC 49455]SQA60994.1 Probable diguanylate cyclase YeaP [Yokenella regensburgei]SQA66990.1 Probable diguanylate cyclase YeaP [Yokenella regensburgei]